MSDRRWQPRVFLVGALIAISLRTAAFARAQGAPPAAAGAIVARGLVQFDLAIFDAAPLRVNGALLTGYYAFRIVLDDRTDDSFAIVTDSVIRTTDLRVLARNSRLYRCADPGALSVLSCTAPFTGTVEANPSTLRVNITDSAFVARMNRIRPAYFVLYAMQPGGRFQSHMIQFIYLD